MKQMSLAELQLYPPEIHVRQIEAPEHPRFDGTAAEEADAQCAGIPGKAFVHAPSLLQVISCR